jgi:hypothetical protein
MHQTSKEDWNHSTKDSKMRCLRKTSLFGWTLLTARVDLLRDTLITSLASLVSRCRNVHSLELYINRLRHHKAINLHFAMAKHSLEFPKVVYLHFRPALSVASYQVLVTWHHLKDPSHDSIRPKIRISDLAYVALTTKIRS